MRGLSARRRRFAAEYLVDLNAEQAAVRAGYAPSGAARQGRALLALPEVREAIEEETAARVRRTQVSADRVVEELARIAFADPASLLDTALPASAAEAGSWGWGTGLKVKFTPSRRAAGAEGQPALDVALEREVRIGDKLRALEMLSRHLGLDLRGEEAPAGGVVLLPEIEAETEGEDDAG